MESAHVAAVANHRRSGGYWSSPGWSTSLSAPAQPLPGATGPGFRSPSAAQSLARLGYEQGRWLSALPVRSRNSTRSRRPRDYLEVESRAFCTRAHVVNSFANRNASGLKRARVPHQREASPRKLARLRRTSFTSAENTGSGVVPKSVTHVLGLLCYLCPRLFHPCYLTIVAADEPC